MTQLTSLANEQHGVAAQQSAVRRSGRPVKRFGPFGRFVLVTVALVLCFSKPLYHLMQFAVAVEFHSYILLVPFVSFYLVWLKRQSLSHHSEPVRTLAVLPLAAGAMVLAGYWYAVHATSKLADGDSVALITLSFVLFFLGDCLLFLGKETLQAIAFPIGFLVFMVPIPVFLSNWVVALLQHGSAAIAYGLFRLSGTPVFRYDMEFQLPGFSMQVAPECSGIQSSLVLFLTSLLAGHLFLRTPWKRAVLILAVIPLGILRNGFRIFTIGQLCARLGPEMIRSPIHRHGGPLFFVLFLAPFFLLLVVLYKSDRVREKRNPKQLGV
jgi:exosortase C (VPDSG-CTERM-specific)